MENTSSSREITELPLFAGLSAQEFECVAGSCEVRHYKNGETIFSEGDACAGLYILRLGRAKLLRSDNDRQQLLAFPRPGDPLDLVPLLDLGPHTCAAQARGPVSLFFFDSSCARELIWSNPRLLSNVLYAVAGRLRLLCAQVTSLGCKSVEGRVCEWILQTAEEEGREQHDGIHLSLTLSRRELAALLGTTREVIWRTLSKLQEVGVISAEGNEIVIRQRERLARLA